MGEHDRQDVIDRFLLLRIAVDAGTNDPSDLVTYADLTGEIDLMALARLTAEDFAEVMQKRDGKWPLEWLRATWPHVEGRRRLLNADEALREYGLGPEILEAAEAAGLLHPVRFPES